MDLTDSKMAIICEQNKFVQPVGYFSCMHDHTTKLDAMTSSVGSQVDNWSKVMAPGKVVKYMPHENKLLLNNGKEYTYKALVLSPGLDHRSDLIEGLEEMENLPEEENFFVHKVDTDKRLEKNFQAGWNHNFGDMICYSPKAPYKGEGSDFYALYFESFLR